MWEAMMTGNSISRADVGVASLTIVGAFETHGESLLAFSFLIMP